MLRKLVHSSFLGGDVDGHRHRAKTAWERSTGAEPALSRVSARSGPGRLLLGPVPSGSCAKRWQPVDIRLLCGGGAERNGINNN